jgi:hypothetical protein
MASARALASLSSRKGFDSLSTPSIDWSFSAAKPVMSSAGSPGRAARAASISASPFMPGIT